MLFNISNIKNKENKLMFVRVNLFLAWPFKGNETILLILADALVVVN